MAPANKSRSRRIFILEPFSDVGRALLPSRRSTISQPTPGKSPPQYPELDTIDRIPCEISGQGPLASEDLFSERKTDWAVTWLLCSRRGLEAVHYGWSILAGQRLPCAVLPGSAVQIRLGRRHPIRMVAPNSWGSAMPRNCLTCRILPGPERRLRQSKALMSLAWRLAPCRS